MTPHGDSLYYPQTRKTGMPYPTIADLPETVKEKVPAEKLEQFRAVFNEVFTQTKDESRAFASAYSAVGVEKIAKAAYQGREVALDKPFRLEPGASKKFGVYVKDGEKVKKVTFGDPDMEIRRDDPKARANFRARHSCDTQKDKTSAAYWSCRMWDKDVSVSELTKSNLDGEIFRVDDEQRIVWGWASVTKVNGEYVVDRHGHVITSDTMLKAATAFMEKSLRAAKTEHYGDTIGAVVHSLPVTEEIFKALGISCDREGWIIGMKIYNDDVWAMVKAGEFPAFSFGGQGALMELGD